MDLNSRRAILTTSRSPESRLDYVVTLSGNLRGFGRVQIRYVPDKLILDLDSFAQYLSVWETAVFPNVERTAATILDDLSNELVARWLQVSISHSAAGDSPIADHSVLIEDRQPKWDNPSLLSRLTER